MTISNQYRDYIKCSFLKYSFSIISLLFALAGLFLFINVEWISAEGNEKNNTLLAEILDRQVGDHEKGLVRFTSDYRVLEALKDKDSGRVTEVNRLLYEFSIRQSIRCNSVLTGSDGAIVSSNLFEENRDIFLNSTVYQSLFEKMVFEPNKIFTLPSRLNYARGQEGDLILLRAVSDPSKVLGYLFFGLSNEQIYETVRNYPLNDMILTDRYDNLIFSISRQSAGPMGKYLAGKYGTGWERGNVARADGKRYHIQRKMLPESILVLYTPVSMEFQRTLVFYGMLLLGLVGILMPIMISPLTFRIARKNPEAIDGLQTSMAGMGRGNMDYKLKGQAFGEFKVLGDAFRKAALQREELMLHSNELAERKRVVEIRQLKERFNPHLISNVLETLRYEIVIDGAKASDTVMAFVNLMRYSIYYGSTIVPPQTDTENISDYLPLRKVRYNRRLNYHIDIPEELLGCRIPKLLPQPAVENSLVHGMEDIHSVSVTTSVWMTEGNLKLCVEDNGSGTGKERLEELREGLGQGGIYREYIGLYNSHRVVRLSYGPAYGMTIDSSPSRDARVIITLSAETKDGYV